MNIPNNQSALDEWVDWLLHLHTQEIDLGLERIAQVAKVMGVLKPAPLVVTVAGTNGKGSSVAMLTAIFKAAGYKVGTYTSPHISSFAERIQIDNQMVAEQTIVDAFHAIEQARGNTKLTYFEFSTLAALNVFNNADLDVVVLEVGLGGRLDAVNVVDADATLITAIDIDHVDWLGDDRSVIATEKAGVMRAQQLSVCSDPDVPTSLINYADKLAVKLYLLNRDFGYRKLPNNWCLTDCAEHCENQCCYDLPALKGDFQIQNAAGVVKLCQLISENQTWKMPIAEAAINQGLSSVSHPGRLQEKQVGQQRWLIDVAHNPQSAQVLAEYLESQNWQKSPAVFSALNDKDMLPMVKAIAPYVSDWYIAGLAIPRASSLQQLTDTLTAAGVAKDSIIQMSSIAHSVNSLVASNESEAVLVWGSFFTVSQVLQSLEHV